jgi:hypothetical protein
VDGVIELAVTRAVKEAFPLVPIEYENSLLRVARYPHENPLRPIRRYRAAGRGHEGDLDRAIAVTRALPSLRARVDTEFGDRGLGGHGFLATPQ